MRHDLDFRFEGDVDSWFKDNYFYFGFDWVIDFWPGDFLGYINDTPVIIELEYYSSGVWFHEWHIRKYFDYLICFHMNEIDKIRFENASMKWIAIDEVFKDEIQKERTQRMCKMLGISNPF
jgi:hypothetical protein